MRWRPHFTLLSLFAFVTAIAGVLSALTWYHRSCQVDPRTEQFTAGESKVTIAWDDIPWEAERTGFWISGAFESPVGWNADTRPFHQELFRVRYENRAGTSSVDALFSLDGSRNPEWTEFLLWPEFTGDRIEDYALQGTTEFDETNNVLRIHLQEVINSRRLARQTELVYDFDGSQFRLRDAPNQRATVDLRDR